MKWKDNIWGYLIAFITGVLLCYLSLQFSILELNFEVAIPDFLLSIATILVGIYIAHTIQKNVNRTQNQYTYIEMKIDSLWSTFNSFSQILIYNDSIEVQRWGSYNKDVVYPIEFIKSIFEAFDIEPTSINNLRISLESLDTLMTSFNSTDNIINFSAQKSEILSQLKTINHDFSKVLKHIQLL
ncbi:hypothetical protein [Alistipes finegoldii]|uniref:hypothetical protein n=1 Tax=Alistipes finegoldii TaxID=214856 RepID=UPI002673DDF3|nr:hypothetical protein [Alistipes finegoldii]